MVFGQQFTFVGFYVYKLYLLLLISYATYIFKPGMLAEAHARFLEIAFVHEVRVSTPKTINKYSCEMKQEEPIKQVLLLLVSLYDSCYRYN